ncbi:MAG: cyclic nucleotide-binding domain-containing protein [Anaerolineae bacterium]|nr:cyclic nucleotide-binding domain-containing protein [Anaerolineae bacterium]
MQRDRVLGRADIFRGLASAHLEKLAAVCHDLTFQKGEIIVQQNAPSDELYIIVKGAVDIVIDPALLDVDLTDVSGPVMIVTLGRGQTFGEIGLVDLGLRSATARAASKETQLFSIRRADLLQLCESDFELGYHLMRNIASELAFKIRNTDLMLRAQLLWEPRIDS